MFPGRLCWSGNCWFPDIPIAIPEVVLVASFIGHIWTGPSFPSLPSDVLQTPWIQALGQQSSEIGGTWSDTCRLYTLRTV